MARRVWFAVLVLSLLVAVTACDGAEEDAVDVEALSTTQDASAETPQLLTPADVEQASGLSGLESAPYDPASPVLLGNINIVDAAGTRIVSVYLGDAENWELWLTDGSSVAEPVMPPVGEESFIGPSPDVSPVITLFAFRTGGQAVLIETGQDANGETLLSSEQLRALADVIAARL